jgi:S1-C subfamily serine protease
VAAVALVLSGAVGIALAIGSRGSTGIRQGIGQTVASATTTAARSEPAPVGPLAAEHALAEVDDSGGSGSAMVPTSDGEVLTSASLLDNTSDLKVIDEGNGQTYTTVVMGYDRDQGIVLLHRNGAHGLATTNISSDHLPAAGTPVAGLTDLAAYGGVMASTGKITDLNRGVQGGGLNSPDFMGIDVQLQPRYFGGPLVDNNGTVVGIDLGTDTSNPNVGFALPMTVVMSIARQIEQRITSPAVHVGPAASIGISVKDHPNGIGAEVATVTPKSPAAAAGVVVGCEVAALGATSVHSADDLVAAVRSHNVGDQVPLTWTDAGGGTHTAPIVLVGAGN